jgi:photosystem II stability/assembly factor-like uncharacterized protein
VSNERILRFVNGPWPCCLVLLLFVQAPALAAGNTDANTKPRNSSSQPKARPPSTKQPGWKGVWEPVSYGQDLELTDAYFVTADTGYVSGASGTILKTTDGGASWTPQLGGEAQGQDPKIAKLRFVDSTHGWALQVIPPFGCCTLLRTSDGESWERAGTLPEGWGAIDYQFVSRTTGFLLDGNNNVSHIFRTTDGGRSWKEVFSTDACHARLEIEGVVRETPCVLSAMHFPTPSAGFAIGTTTEHPKALFVARTKDGGASWSVSGFADFGRVFTGSGYDLQRAWFIDEKTGFVNLLHYESSEPYVTRDGGHSWKGVSASLPGETKFADPEVGWTIDHYKYGLDYVLKYSADGGVHWSSRSFRFPAEVLAFSLPRRDRGYVVGNHGMVYRYRVVPAAYAAVGAIDAPAMPRLESPVFGQLATLNETLVQLRAKLAVAASQTSAQGATPPAGQASSNAPQTDASQQSPGTSGTAPTGGFQQDTSSAPNQPDSADAGTGTGFQQGPGAPAAPDGGSYMDICCGQLVQQLEQTANAFATDVPAFSQRFRNLNLVFEGLDFLTKVVDQTKTLLLSIRALRQAPDAQAAAAALDGVSTQVGGISSNGAFVQDTASRPQK